MSLDEDIRVYLESVADVPRASELDRPVSELRAAVEAMWTDRHPGEFPLRTRDLTIAGRDGPIAARHYEPAADASGALLLFFHGGGFVFGNLDSHDEICRRLSFEGELQVVSVDYRLAPEHPFPAAVHDVIDSLEWAVAQQPSLEYGPGQLFVAGDSAGANLAAVAAHHALDSGIALAGQALIYPVTDFRQEVPYESRQTRARGYGLTQTDMLWYGEHYLGDAGLADDPLVSPMVRPDLSGLAPAFLMTAGYDPLSSEGEAYAERLSAAGVPVEYLHLPGANHGVFTEFRTFRSGEATWQALLRWLDFRISGRQADT